MDMQVSSRPANRLSFRLCFQTAVCLLLLFQFPLTPIAIAQLCDIDSVASLPCESVLDPGAVGSNGAGFRHVGNPVDVVTGSKQQHEIDFQAVGSPLHFSRYYHSSQTENNASIGQGWRHSYLVRLYSVDAEHWRIQQADGRWIDFTLVESDSDKTLFRAGYEGDGFLVDDGAVRWELPDGRTMRFQGSFLTRIDYPHGRNLHLFYENRQLVSVSDGHGRELRLKYSLGRDGLPDYQQSLNGEHKGHLNAVLLPSGQRVNYQYDSNRNLVRVGYPDGQERKYQFKNTTYPHHLSAITSLANGSTDTRTWVYDGDGRVDKFLHPAKNSSMSITYRHEESADNSGVTVVDYVNGRQEQYRWQTEPDTGDARVVDVRVVDCIDCKPVHRQIEPRRAQVPSYAIEQKRQLSITRNQSSVQTQLLVDGVNQGVFPQFDQLDPSPLSLDQKTQVTLDGVSYSLLIVVSRLGEVNDISVGSTSLSELRNKWSQGDIEKCDMQPRLQRSKIFPAPDKGCLEDLIYLIELARHVEQLSRTHGIEPTMPMERSGAANGAQPGCLQNPFSSCSELERDFQLAQLSSCAYGDVVQVCGQDWQAVAPQSLGLDESLFKDGSFSSTLFQNQVTGEYILAFRGTDNAGDWRDNFLQASGAATQQYRSAVALAKELDQVLPDGSLTFTGHSLGGGLATAAALSIDAPANVFNPAALHPDTAATLNLDYAAAQNLVKVTTVDGDLLTSIQQSGDQQTNSSQSPQSGRFPAPGRHTVLSAPSDDWIDEERKQYSILARSDGVVLHSIDAVLETEDNLLVEFCGKTPSRA